MPLLVSGKVVGRVPKGEVSSIPVAPPMSVSGMLVPSGTISDMIFDDSAIAGMHRREDTKNIAKAMPISPRKRLLNLFFIENIFVSPFLKYLFKLTHILTRRKEFILVRG